MNSQATVAGSTASMGVTASASLQARSRRAQTGDALKSRPGLASAARHVAVTPSGRRAERIACRPRSRAATMWLGHTFPEPEAGSVERLPLATLTGQRGKGTVQGGITAGRRHPRLGEDGAYLPCERMQIDPWHSVCLPLATGESTHSRRRTRAAQPLL
jgi:hypothetical protein